MPLPAAVAGRRLHASIMRKSRVRRSATNCPRETRAVADRGEGRQAAGAVTKGAQAEAGISL